MSGDNLPPDQRPTRQIPRVDPRREAETMVPCPWCELCGVAPGVVTPRQRGEWEAAYPALKQDQEKKA